ncbi:MAG: SprB repeat-containing protein [Saprospiraceae bacterium]|uniref:SprB repeat-containing protein n=1 Tax=Candidatus Defluviibacterium haderslevense TaxID=2981993 RepID=A0A9D7S7G2_9BACT|nr:SprB repeat-containing protein [Candidatus Defluviibacterium haderslevense]MBL0236362.1 SprB repeat-containing protein [Candidatus Defluviibacterium haderslevense]
MRTLIKITLLLFTIDLVAKDLNIIITPPSNGECNGKIDLTILGGYPLYDIVWTNNQGVVKDESGITGGDGREDINNLCPNIQYCVSINDAACGVLNYCWTLTECPVITVSAVIIPFPRPSSCASMDGGLRVLSSSQQGGQAPFNYHIEDQHGNRYTLDNNSYVGNLSSGKYYFVVTDANGCTGRYGIDLIAEDGFHITLSNLQHTCQGSSDGLIEIYSISNDINETFNYHWSNGINHLNIPWADPSLIDHLSAGKYCVTVTSNSTSCELIDCYTIKGNTNTPLNLNSTLEMPCKDTRNGKINLTVTGGTLPYTYVWDPPGTIPGFGLYAGTYCVTVTDFCGASVHQCFELKEVAYELQSGILCKDQGWGEIHVMNGNPPYSITWFVNGIGAIGHGLRIDNLSNGNYSVFGHDAKNCNFNNTFEINYINKNFIEFMHNNSTCNGDADSRDGEIRIGSIDNSNYTFSWTGPYGFTSTSRNISMLRPGNYKVTITDPDGCTEKLEQIICCCSSSNTDYPSCGTFPPITAMSDEQAVTIDNGCNGYIHLTVSGGSGTYFYQWTGPNGYSSKLKDIDKLCKGDYCVTITDGCQSFTKCIPIPECSENQLLGNGVVVNTCPTFNAGSIKLNASGGKPMITYKWKGPSGFSSTSSIIENLFAGTYTVTLTDAQKCTKVESYTILENIQYAVQRGCPEGGKCDLCNFCPNVYKKSYVISYHRIIPKVNQNCEKKEVCEDDESIVVSGPTPLGSHFEWDSDPNACIGYKVCNGSDVRVPYTGITMPKVYEGKLKYKGDANVDHFCFYCFNSEKCVVYADDGAHSRRVNSDPGNLYIYLKIDAGENGNTCPVGQCYIRIECAHSPTVLFEKCTSDPFYCKDDISNCNEEDIPTLRKDTIIDGKKYQIISMPNSFGNDIELSESILNESSLNLKFNKFYKNLEINNLSINSQDEFRISTIDGKFLTFQKLPLSNFNEYVKTEFIIPGIYLIYIYGSNNIIKNVKKIIIF